MSGSNPIALGVNSGNYTTAVTLKGVAIVDFARNQQGSEFSKLDLSADKMNQVVSYLNNRDDDTRGVASGDIAGVSRFNRDFAKIVGLDPEKDADQLDSIRSELIRANNVDNFVNRNDLDEGILTAYKFNNEAGIFSDTISNEWLANPGQSEFVSVKEDRVASNSQDLVASIPDNHLHTGGLVTEERIRDGLTNNFAEGGFLAWANKVTGGDNKVTTQVLAKRILDTQSHLVQPDRPKVIEYDEGIQEKIESLPEQVQSASKIMVDSQNKVIIDTTINEIEAQTTRFNEGFPVTFLVDENNKIVTDEFGKAIVSTNYIDSQEYNPERLQDYMELNPGSKAVTFRRAQTKRPKYIGDEMMKFDKETYRITNSSLNGEDNAVIPDGDKLSFRLENLGARFVENLEDPNNPLVEEGTSEIYSVNYRERKES